MDLLAEDVAIDPAVGSSLPFPFFFFFFFFFGCLKSIPGPAGIKLFGDMIQGNPRFLSDVI